MKHYYDYFIGMLTLGMFSVYNPCVNAQSTANKINVDDLRMNKTVLDKKTASPIIKKSESKGRPQTVSTYFFNNNTQEWRLSTINTYTYGNFVDPLNGTQEIYSEGKLLGTTKFDNSFNDEGNIIETITQIKGANASKYTNESRLKFIYDEIRKDIVISRGKYIWNKSSKDWEVGPFDYDSYDYELTRDDMQRLTEMKYYTNIDRKDAPFRYVYGYGDSEGATTMDLYSLDNQGNLSKTFVYKIQNWHSTDCQYLIPNNNFIYFFEKDKTNKPSKYEMYMVDENGSETQGAKIQIDYDDQDRPIYLTVVTGDQFYTRQYEYNLEGGIAEKVTECSWYDTNSNGEYEDKEFEGGAVVETVVNEYNDVIANNYYDFDKVDGSDIELSSSFKSEYTYEDGNMIQSILYLLNIDTKEYMTYSRTEYADFVENKTNITSVNTKPNVIFENNHIYFNNASNNMYIITDLNGNKIEQGIVTKQGVSVDNLPSGIYLVKVMGNNGASIKIITR